MSVITTVKNDLQTLFESLGIPADQIVRNQTNEDDLVNIGMWPVIGLITADASFDNDTEQGIRVLRHLPVEIHIIAESEDAATDILEQAIDSIPEVVDYDDRNIAVSIEAEMHSDHVAAVTSYYVCVLVVAFEISHGG